MASQQTQAPRKRTAEEVSVLKRAGAFAGNAGRTRAERAANGRSGVEAVVRRAMGDVGDLETRDPAEFGRRYTMALQAHMARMQAAHIAKAAEARNAKAMKYAPLVLLSACPDCNAEAGLGVPAGFKQELCITHWFAAKAQLFGAMLDDVQAQIAS